MNVPVAIDMEEEEPHAATENTSHTRIVVRVEQRDLGQTYLQSTTTITGRDLPVPATTTATPVQPGEPRPHTSGGSRTLYCCGVGCNHSRAQLVSGDPIETKQLPVLFRYTNYTIGSGACYYSNNNNVNKNNARVNHLLRSAFVTLGLPELSVTARKYTSQQQQQHLSIRPFESKV